MNSPPTQIPIIIPDLGADNIPCLLTAWYVEPGEFVCKGDFLYEVTIQQAAVTIHSPQTGYLEKTLRNINEQTSPHEVIGYLTLKEKA